MFIALTMLNYCVPCSNNSKIDIMGKITLIIMCLVAPFISAQTTYDILWKIGVNGVPASPTLELGDTVKWTWDDGLPHSVTNKPGSQETFDSGIESGSGFEYSYTFNEEGINDYQCDVHPGSMFGTVTVMPVLAIEDKFVKNLSFYPNPVKNDLTVFSLFKLDKYDIYNVLGAKVGSGKGTGNYTQIDLANLTSGMYFVKVASGDLRATLKVAKR